MQLDLSFDYVTWTNPEPVTFTSTRRTSPISQYVPGAMRLELDTQDAGGGVYTKGLLDWLLPTPQLGPGLVPKPADLVIDRDGVTYTALDVRGQCRDTNGFQVYKVHGIALAIAYDLRDNIDLERAQITFDAAGAEVKQWPSTDGKGVVLYSKLAARVQEDGRDVVEERGIQGFKGTHKVYLSQKVPNITFEDRVKWTFPGPGGNLTYYLNVLGMHNPDVLDDLPVLDCTLAP